MSEAMTMPPLGAVSEKRVPTVYFIDDSATMREVIKIAFRRENMNVVTCADASAAFSQFAQTPPDVVITDVIMPDQDGYSVCSQIKQNPEHEKTPVILMSGVVNKSVADRAVAVHADELVRKPFQPQELIARVKKLLDPHGLQTTQPAEKPSPASPLSGLFAQQSAAPVVPPMAATPPRVQMPAPHSPVPLMQPHPVEQRAQEATAESAWPRALAEAFTHPQAASAAPVAHTPQPPRVPQINVSEIQRLKAEISMLELQIKKLQTELQIERQYNQALELHVRTLTQVD